MLEKFILDGNDWTVTGLWRNQTAFTRSYTEKLIDISVPAVSAIPAIVPGAVNNDLMRAGLIPDYNIDTNSVLGEWVEHREWVYTKEFTFHEERKGVRNILCFDGLDYEGDILLNDKLMTSFKGTFRLVEINVTEYLNYGNVNILQVLFKPTPEIDGMYGYSSKVRHLKSRFNYLWDWCVRIVPVGIWDHVYIEARESVYLKDVFPQAGYVDGIGRLQITGEAECSVPGRYTLELRIFPVNGCTDVYAGTIEMVLSKGVQRIEQKLEVEGVLPWWPNGSGDANLYDLSVSLLDTEGKILCCDVKTIGFRSCRFLHNPGAAAGTPPYTAEINGKRVFIKGVNWVPISPLYGCVTKKDYLAFIQRFKDMNCNLLRVWGGAIIEKKEFYEVCDQLGMMVWQELLQSSSAIENMPPKDPDFLEDFRKIAAAAICKRRHHASHVVWCGGNELTQTETRGIAASQEHENLKMLDELVKDLDPDKYFLPCSPFGPEFFGNEKTYGKGVHYDVHGRWNYMEDHYVFYDRDDSLFRSEVGTPGASSAETIRSIAHKLHSWPPNEKNPLWLHHGSCWIQWEQLTRLFGQWDEDKDLLEEYVMASQYLQAESLRYVVEAVRRREPAVGGVIIWMGNEPFANTSNTSLLDYNGKVKPVYYWIKKVFSRLHLSCKYEKLSYCSGDKFCGEVFIHSEDRKLNGGFVRAELVDLHGKVIIQSSWAVDDTTEAPKKLGDIRWNTTCVPGNIFFLKLDFIKGDNTINLNTYLFTLDCEHPLQPLRQMQPAVLKAEIIRESEETFSLSLYNSSDIAAVMVTASIEGDCFSRFSDGCMIIFPGERVFIDGSHCREAGKVTVKGFNVRPVDIAI